MIEIIGYTKIGPTIKNLRIDKDYTLTELSEITGISQPYLSQIENGKKTPSSKILKKLADALKVPYTQLLKLAGNNELVSTYIANQTVNNVFDNKVTNNTGSIQSIERLMALEQATDLKILLEQQILNITSENIRPSYNGHLLTEDDRQRILGMLTILFPHYQNPKSN